MKKNCLLWLLVAAMAMTSCQDEFIKNENKTSDKIGYSVVTTDISSPYKARSGESVGTKQVEIDDLDGTVDGKQVYLHTITDMVMPMDIKSLKKDAQPQSRGAVNTTAGILASDTEIGVTSIVWNGDAWEDDDEKKLYMDNLPCESPDFKTNFYWPAAEDYIRFFAYYPYGAEYKDGEHTSEVSINSSDKTEPYMRWVVPATPDKQDDLLVASANYAGNYKNQATLKFGHALTGVQILISGEVSNIEVNAIHFNGVKYKGKYFYSTVNGNDTDAGEWDVDSDTTTISLTELEVTPANASKDDSGYAIVNEDENVFMMMPQTLTDAKLVINLTNTNTDKEISLMGDLSGKTWNKGYMVKYVISLNDEREEYELEVLDENGNNIAEYKNGETVVPNTRSFPYYGGYGKYQVRSFKRIISAVGDVTIEQIPWQIDAENTTGVDMLSQMSGNGVTSESGIEGVYTYCLMPRITSSSHTSICGKGSFDTDEYKENHVDLSMLQLDTSTPLANGRHTANCYLVRRPGYFRIPIVYGNAIVDGSPNTNAYTSTIASTSIPFTADLYKLDASKNEVKTNDQGSINATILRNFVDHKGNAIKGAWIADQGEAYAPSVAEIVWQDSPFLLTDLKVEQFDDADGGARDFICFHVPTETVVAGNAVVAVKNSAGEVMWSWHIYVTPKPVNSKWIVNRRVLGNYNNNDLSSVNWLREENTFELAQFSIGQCDAEVVYYNQNSIDRKFIIVQVDDKGTPIVGGASKVVNIALESGSEEVTVNAPVYQWGRKDPMLPYHMGSGVLANKKFYDNNGNQSTTLAIESAATDRNSIPYSISNPGTFIVTSGAVTSGNVKYQNWCNELYLNLWNANCDKLPMFSYISEMEADDYHKQFNEIVSIPMVKTVYDPCPAGYEMPRIDTFTGITFDGTTLKPYWNESDIEDKANVFNNSPTSTTFEFAFYRKPMITSTEHDVAGVEDDRGYWTMGFGHRRNGNAEQYANYGAALTSALICIQWIGENKHADSYPEQFDLQSSRLAYIAGKLDEETRKTGTLRPIFGSAMDLAFPIIPVKTGCNPSKTEVSVSGNINGWIENDEDRIDITL